MSWPIAKPGLRSPRSARDHPPGQFLPCLLFATRILCIHDEMDGNKTPSASSAAAFCLPFLPVLQILLSPFFVIHSSTFRILLEPGAFFCSPRSASIAWLRKHRLSPRPFKRSWSGYPAFRRTLPPTSRVISRNIAYQLRTLRMTQIGPTPLSKTKPLLPLGL